MSDSNHKDKSFNKLKPLTYDTLDKYLKALIKPKKTFSLIAYCNTRKHVVDYGEHDTGLCADPECYWCSKLKAGMKEEAKKHLNKK